MSKILFVGDPHIQVSNLEESEKLMAFIVKTASEKQAEELVVAGDLFHTHAVIRMEVLAFWTKWVKTFNSTFKKVHLLVGNHDQIGDKQREGKLSALDSLQEGNPNVIVWNSAGIHNGMAFIPYTSNHSLFIKTAEDLFTKGASRLFCHQTFDGSKYDNGFYAPDGIDQNLLPKFEEIVSGHIHTEQKIGNVFYPGTPKWDTISDANQEKGIWISSNVRDWEKIPTAKVCLPYIKRYVSEESFNESDLDLELTPRTIIELSGTSSWIGKISKKLKGKCRLIAKPTDSAVRKKSQTAHQNIFSYLAAYSNVKSNKESLQKYLEALCQ